MTDGGIIDSLKDELIDEKDYLRLFQENIYSCPAWQILPGATYEMSYTQLINTLNDEFDEMYAEYAKQAPDILKFTVTFLGRHTTSHYDCVLLFVAEIGRLFTVDASQIIPTNKFTHLESLDDVKAFRQAYLYMVELER